MDEAEPPGYAGAGGEEAMKILLIAGLLASGAWAQAPDQGNTYRQDWPLQGVRNVVIDLPAGRLSLRHGQGETIQAEGRLLPAAHLHQGRRGQTLYIHWQAPLARPPQLLDLQLTLPALDQLRIQGLHLSLQFERTRTGRLELSLNQLEARGSLQTERLKVEALQGRLDLQLEQTKYTEVSLLGGQVSLRGLTGQARVSLLNGPLQLEGNRFVELMLNNQNGGISLETGLLPQARVQVETLAGSIRVSLPDNRYRCRFETLTGQWFLNDQPMPAAPAEGRPRQLDCSPPEGQGPLLQFRSQTGSLHLSRP